MYKKMSGMDMLRKATNPKPKKHKKNGPQTMESYRNPPQEGYNNFSVKTKKYKKGMTPKGAHGRAAVKQLGRTKTTGNFAKIAKAKGKGAAIAAFQNAKATHEGKPAPYHAKKSVKSKMKCKNHKKMHCKMC